MSIGTREDVELDPPAYDTQADNVPLECRLGEIADVLQRLSASAEAGDSKVSRLRSDHFAVIERLTGSFDPLRYDNDMERPNYRPFVGE